MSIIGILIWVFVMIGIVKSFSGSGSKKTQPNQNSAQKTVQQIKTGAQKVISEISAYANEMEQPGQQKRQMTADDRARLDAYRQQKAANPAQQPYVAAQPYTTAQKSYAAAQPYTTAQKSYAAAQPQPAARQSYAAAKPNTAAQQQNIVERAKQNANKYAEDTTLEQLEKEHKHSERESKAEAAYVAKERQEHQKLHTQPHPPVEEESLLGSVQDLMVKGYDGNLSFERDFVGEAMDLLNSFTVQ